MNNDFELIDIKIIDPIRENGVMYVGQYGTSGYATAAKGYIYDFFTRGVPLTWTPLRFDDSELSDDIHYNIIAKSTINRKIPDIRTIILHCTADLWPQYKAENPDKFLNKNIIGYTVWETNCLPQKWPEYINQSVNEVWVPSTYNMETFQNSGVTIPIKVVPHIFLRSELPKREHVSIKVCSGEPITADPNVFTFYSISELNERKNVMGLIDAYGKAFTRADNVRLILKVHYKSYSIENLTYCVSKVTNALKNYPDHAPVYLLSRNLSELEMLALHSIGDCCVSLTRSEAFGLTIYDAVNYGKKAIVTGYGGQVDFLGKEYAGLVNYEMVDVKDMDTFTHGYYMEGKQQWANPNVEHAIALMKSLV